MVRNVQGSVPERHDRVADIFVDGPAPFHDLLGHRREVPVHETRKVLGRVGVGFRQRGEITDVAEHDRQLAGLAGQLELFGIADQRIDHDRGKILTESAADRTSHRLFADVLRERQPEHQRDDGERRIGGIDEQVVAGEGIPADADRAEDADQQQHRQQGSWQQRSDDRQQQTDADEEHALGAQGIGRAAQVVVGVDRLQHLRVHLHTGHARGYRGRLDVTQAGRGGPHGTTRLAIRAGIETAMQHVGRGDVPIRLMRRVVDPDMACPSVGIATPCRTIASMPPSPERVAIVGWPVATRSASMASVGTILPETSTTAGTRRTTPSKSASKVTSPMPCAASSRIGTLRTRSAKCMRWGRGSPLIVATVTGRALAAAAWSNGRVLAGWPRITRWRCIASAIAASLSGSARRLCEDRRIHAIQGSGKLRRRKSVRLGEDHIERNHRRAHLGQTIDQSGEHGAWPGPLAHFLETSFVDVDDHHRRRLRHLARLDPHILVEDLEARGVDQPRIPGVQAKKQEDQDGSGSAGRPVEAPGPRATLARLCRRRGAPKLQANTEKARGSRGLTAGSSRERRIPAGPGNSPPRAPEGRRRGWRNQTGCWLRQS